MEDLNAKTNILVVDDELGPRESMRMILKPYYNVITAENGEIALKLIKEFPIDIMTLDLKMPGLSGLEVLKEVRKYSPDTEIIIISGYGTLQTANEAMKYGVVNFVTKPFDVFDIITAVERSLERKRFNYKLNHFFKEILSEDTTLTSNDKEEKKSPFQELSANSVIDKSILSDYPSELPFSEDLLDISEQKVKKIKKLKEDFSYEVKVLEEKLIQAEKLATVGQLSSGFAHEVNNIICSIGGYAQFVQQKLAKKSLGELSDIMKDIEVIINQSERATKLMQNFLGFSRKNKDEESLVNVTSIIDKVLSFISYKLRNLNIEVVKEYEADLPELLVDPNKLEQVFLNIIVNAIHAMPQGGKIQITARFFRRQGEGFVRIDFKDTGCGIPEENHKKIFDPFFTTKDKGMGTGLGLFICRRIVEGYQGRIELASKVGEGTTFTIDLPVIRRASNSFSDKRGHYN